MSKVKPVPDGVTPVTPSLVTDPFGHQWQIATHKEDLTHDEMRTRMAAMSG